MAAREGEKRGRGVPLSDVERVMRHYNIDEETACYYLSIHPIEMLIPERGYGLTAGSPAPLTGTSMDELATALNLMEDSLSIGQKARLELATYEMPTRDDLEILQLDMLWAGFHVSKPTAKVVDGIPLTSMVLTKGSPQWALLIPLIVPIAIMGLIAFGIVKLETITKALLPLMLTVGGLAIIALGIMRQPAARAAEMAAAKYLR